MAIDTISRALSGQASTAAKQAKETADSAMEQAIAAVPGAVSDWLEDNVTPTTPAVDASLSIAGAAADAKATGDGIADLKSALNGIFTDQIVGMNETGENITSANLFKYAKLVGAGKAIYSIANGKVTLVDFENYNTYIVRVDGESIYTFTYCRSAVVISDLEYTAVSALLTYRTQVDSVGGKYIIFSFLTSSYPPETYSITKPDKEYYIPENWNISEKEISSSQISGMQITGSCVDSENLFSNAVLVAANKYVSRITNGKAVLADLNGLDTYLIAVDGESVYKFTNARTAAVVTDLQYTAVGSLLTYATQIDSTGGAYILFSINPVTYPPSSYIITKPLPVYKVPNNWDLDRQGKTLYQRAVGTIASGGSLALMGKIAVKYGHRIAFKAFITSFNEIDIQFKNYNNIVTNTLKVTSEQLTVSVGSTVTDNFSHGLTIANDITIILDYKKPNAVEITVESNGHKYTAQTTFERLTSAAVSATVLSVNTVCSSAIFELVIGCAKKPIWYFGDSYISTANPARWPYYLIDNEYDNNVLFNGYAGATSAASNMALTALLSYGTPKYAIFGTGMNDGSDTSTTPSIAWINARDAFITMCETNGIEPIFCTVPTVPTVNNEQKNAWVKSSGYRYIDFAKAVGANANGEWYNAMLSSDGVHPAVEGAIALFTQALTDFPEFLE